MNRLPIAKTELREIVEQDCLYVDKTHFVKMLVEDNHKYYFLSRPRRFGKSLFVDTLRAAFAGEKELFKGLYIGNNWDWEKKYPVIKISFGAGTVDSAENLNIRINEIINEICRINTIQLTNTSIPGKFEQLIHKLSEKHNEKIVVLIDEYDKPLLDNITKNETENIRESLSSFYSVLKDASKYLKFVFLAGVSKFSKTSIFSKLNNLTDISLVPKYADICGITQSEFETVFTDCLEDVDLASVKNWYNGYNFRGSNVYNPYDLLMFLWEKEYKSYWFKTGTPTFLLDLIRKRKFYVPRIENIKISESQMEDFDIHNIELDVLLFQTGYLTIKDISKTGPRNVYTLKIPNLEVKMGLSDYLLRMFYASGVNSYERTTLSENIYLALKNKDIQKLKQIFVPFFAGIPHDWYRKNDIAHFEGFYCSMFYAIFASMGLQLIAEDVTNKGRIDLTICLDDIVFIFEFKMNTIHQNALQQIRDKKYYEKYVSEKKEIYLIGIEFDEEEKNISQYEWEKVKD